MKVVDISSSNLSYDFSAVCFSEPKNVSKDTCICAASIRNNKTCDGIVIRMPSSHIIRVSVQKGSATIHAKINKPAIKFIMSLDDRCLTSAVENASEWFMHKVKSSLIEDFFKPSTEVNTKTDGVVARFKLILSEEDMVPNLLEGGYYDLSMKFVGLQFRKQHFCALWQIVSVTPVDEPRVSHTSTKLAFLDDESDDEDDILAQISLDEINTMVHDLQKSLDDVDKGIASKMKELKASSASVKGMKQRLADVLKHISASNIHATMKVLSTLFEELNTYNIA